MAFLTLAELFNKLIRREPIDAQVLSMPTDVRTFQGAANLATGTATAATASSTAVAARATRRSVVVRNEDAAASCRLGAGGTNNFLLKPGESIPIDSVVAITCQRVTTDVALSWMETYD